MSTYEKDNPKYLLLAGKSVFIQTLAPDELVIVFDGPVNSSLIEAASLIKEFGNVTTLQLEKNIGPGKARHAGILKASHEIVAVMDSDDLSRPNRFEVQLSVLKNGVARVIGGLIEEFDRQPGDLERIRNVPENHNEIIAFAKKRSPLNNVTAMFYKTVYLQSGGYGDMRTCEDYDLWYRMLMTGVPFYNIQEVLVDVRTDSRLMQKRGAYIIPYRVRLFYKMYCNGFIGFPRLIFNIAISVGVFLAPKSIRSILYKKVLRHTSNKK